MAMKVLYLLYCSVDTGQVLGWHDVAANVPASAYASMVYSGKVRIIPYDQGVATLPRVGATPPAPWKPSMGDSRPYAQPAETKDILLAYAAQVRFDKSIDGISFTTAGAVVIPVQTDRESQYLIANLAQHASTLATTAAIDFTQDNVHYAMTAADAISMNNAVNAHIQNCRTIEASCIADLNSSTPTLVHYADVDAKFAGV
jgi:hypothetical protein